MRVLMLAALLGSGLYGQDPQPPTQPVQSQPEPAKPPQAPKDANPPSVQIAPGSPWMQYFHPSGATQPKFQVTMNQPAPSTCAIPLLNVGPSHDFGGDPKIAVPQSGSSGDSGMVVKTMPVCPKR